MDFISSGFDEGIKTGIKDSFLSIIDEVAKQGEIVINRTILLTIGREKYSNYITNRIGTFPLFGTSRTAKVSEVYIKVNISKEIEREKYRKITQIEEILKKQKKGETRKLKEDTEPYILIDAINQEKRGFALLGNPGYGKTTAFRNITVSAASGTKIRGKKRIPIFLAVRDMADKQETIWEGAVNFFKWLEIGTPEEVFTQLMKRGRIILLLDGLDETSKEHQKKLLKEIEDLKVKYNESILCISSRPYGLSVGLVGFTKWEVLPMQFDERLEFINKWFASVSPQKGQGLISSSKARPEILDLGSNPFFLSIVCALYYNDLDVPKDVNELYSRCVEGMLGGWDAFRNIARKTILKDYSLKRRKLIINWIAAHLFQNNKIAFDEEDLAETNCIKKISEFLKKDELPIDELLRTLYNDFGILVERAPNIYSFSHLSLQEYCVAEYILNNRQEINLLANYKKRPEWQEVIKLVARMLPNANEFLRYFVNSINLRDENEIPLLLNVLKSNPICSKEVELYVLKKIALLIADVTRFKIHSFKVENQILIIETPSQNLVTQQKKEKKIAKRIARLEQKKTAIEENELSEKEAKIELENNPKNRKFTSNKIRIFSHLAELTNLITKSDFTFRELGVEKNSYFKLVKENTLSNLEGVHLIRIDVEKYRKENKRRT